MKAKKTISRSKRSMRNMVEKKKSSRKMSGWKRFWNRYCAM